MRPLRSYCAFGLFANLIISVSPVFIGSAIFYSSSSCVRYVCVVYSECFGGVAGGRFYFNSIYMHYICIGGGACSGHPVSIRGSGDITAIRASGCTSSCSATIDSNVLSHGNWCPYVSICESCCFLLSVLSSTCLILVAICCSLIEGFIFQHG